MRYMNIAEMKRQCRVFEQGIQASEEKRRMFEQRSRDLDKVIEMELARLRPAAHATMGASGRG